MVGAQDPERPATNFEQPPASATRDTVFDRLEAIPALNVSTYGAGICRRRIRLINESPTVTVGELEDDFHHFRIELRHDGSSIIEAIGTPMRAPWFACMDVAAPLRAVEGNPLSTSSVAVGGYAPATSNCTHLFDLTGLAIAHAVRGTPRRQYDLLLTDDQSDEDGPKPRDMAAWRDGELVIHWVVDNGEIVEPPEWADAPLQHKFIAWAEENLDADLAEAAIAVRRMTHIGIGRNVDLDLEETGAGHMDGPVGRCHTYNPEVLINTIRRKGSVRDFTDPDHAALLLADMGLRRSGTGHDVTR